MNIRGLNDRVRALERDLATQERVPAGAAGDASRAGFRKTITGNTLTVGPGLVEFQMQDRESFRRITATYSVEIEQAGIHYITLDVQWTEGLAGIFEVTGISAFRQTVGTLAQTIPQVSSMEGEPILRFVLCTIVASATDSGIALELRPGNDYSAGGSVRAVPTWG